MQLILLSVKELLKEKIDNCLKEKYGLPYMLCDKKKASHYLARLKINNVLLIDILNSEYIYSNEKLKLSELLYLLYEFNFEEKPKCKICRKKDRKFRGISRGYCESCSIECSKIKSEKLRKEIIDKINEEYLLKQFNLDDAYEENLYVNKIKNNKSNYINKRKKYEYLNKKRKDRTNYYEDINDGTSVSERNLQKFFKDNLHFLDMLFNDRTVIQPYELDIIFTKLKVAIEYNGLAAHDISNIKDNNKNYHFEKTDKCRKLGIKLFNLNSTEFRFLKNSNFSLLEQNDEKKTKFKIILKKIAIAMRLNEISEENKFILPNEFKVDTIESIKDYNVEFKFWYNETNKLYTPQQNSYYNNFVLNSFKRHLKNPKYNFMSLFLKNYYDGDINYNGTPFSGIQYTIINNEAHIVRYFNTKQTVIKNESTLYLFSEQLKNKYNINKVYYYADRSYEFLDEHYFTHNGLNIYSSVEDIELLKPKIQLFKNLGNSKDKELEYNILNEKGDDDFDIEVLDYIYSDSENKNNLKTKIIKNSDFEKYYSDIYYRVYDSGTYKMEIITLPNN